MKPEEIIEGSTEKPTKIKITRKSDTRLISFYTCNRLRRLRTRIFRLRVFNSQTCDRRSRSRTRIHANYANSRELFMIPIFPKNAFYDSPIKKGVDQLNFEDDKTNIPILKPETLNNKPAGSS